MSEAPAPSDSDWILRYNFQAKILLSAAFVFPLFLASTALIYFYLRYAFYRNPQGGRRSPIINRFSHADAGDGENPKPGLDSSAISALPTFIYQATKRDDGSAGDDDDVDCPICLGTFEEGEMVRLLPGCKHLFHAMCIDGWLVTNSTCPVCRAVVKPPPPTTTTPSLVVSTETA